MGVGDRCLREKSNPMREEPIKRRCRILDPKKCFPSTTRRDSQDSNPAPGSSLILA